MPRSILPFLLALAACSGAPREDASASAGASLVGLYERAGAGGAPDRVCVTKEGSEARFAIATAGANANAANCTARGRVSREGSVLRLLIDGAPACSLEATVDAGGLTLAQPEGPDCAYQCGEGAAFTSGAFAKVGSTQADARRLTDVAGEPLC